MDGFIGEIRVFSWSWPPAGWLFCDGSQVPIQQQSALYAVIGTIFGGNGSTYFNLPNLMGEAPMGAGAGPALTPRTLGTSVGTEAVTLNSSEMPAHNHNVTMQGGSTNMTPGPTAGTSSLTRLYSGNGTNLCKNFRVGSTTTPNGSLSPATIGSTGTGGGHENRQPLLAMNFCICVEGVFPVRP